MISEERLIELQEFIVMPRGVYTYLHNTERKENAEDIMLNGFHFEGYLDYTTDQISGIELIELKYFFHQRGRYGRYTVILQIAQALINKYSAMASDSRIHFSEILSQSAALNAESGETTYILPPQFTRGYFDQDKGKIFENNLFNPALDLEVFNDNVKFLKQNKQK